MSDETKIYDAVDIVKEWLEENEYDGLVLPGECGCRLEDLAPCGEDFHGCQAAYLVLRKDFTEEEEAVWPDAEWVMRCNRDK